MAKCQDDNIAEHCQLFDKFPLAFVLEAPIGDFIGRQRRVHLSWLMPNISQPRRNIMIIRRRIALGGEWIDVVALALFIPLRGVNIWKKPPDRREKILNTLGAKKRPVEVEKKCPAHAK